MIVETSGWRHLKEKNKLFLSCEYQKMYHPTPKMAQLSKIDHKSKMENFKSPLCFKKSNYVIRLFSNKPTFLRPSRRRMQYAVLGIGNKNGAPLVEVTCFLVEVTRFFLKSDLQMTEP